MSAPERIDRRELLAGMAATGLVMALPVVLAVPTAAVGAPSSSAEVAADWHVDDMWGVYPRPHEAIGFGRLYDDDTRLAAVHPADLAFVT
jgi:hypothetical protein